mmetsp:Transcript_17263/g.51667  ORF Transcript_17263/g.51667 Transcript_17263/m.51667 type:complete len:571 (-) Transcript_17263:327-2039(-)
MRTLGQHIATRLVELGVTHIFGVPGDFNLVLLDQLISEPKLTFVGCCNELNAGYAADGYARSRGIGAVCTTFTVGGLSVINAIAGSYSESLPIICITGGPNTNDFATNHILHHTIGKPDWNQELRCFKEVTCDQTQINHLDEAHEMVDHCMASALRHRKPVYLNVCCNLAGETHPTFQGTYIPFSIYPKLSNKASLAAAVDAAADFLNKAVKPVLVAGGQLRTEKAMGAFAEVMNASQYPVCHMVNAKGMVDEQHKNFIGTYWGQVSTPYCAETVESADAYLVVGPTFNDYTTTGWTLLMTSKKMVRVDSNSVTIGGGCIYHCITTSEFLTALAAKLKPNDKAMQIHNRMFTPPSVVAESPEGSPLTTNVLFKHIQAMLTRDSSVLAETGDSWFNCQKLRLPTGCGYEFQCQYGSIGWSVGATLGYGIGQALSGKRLIASIGDGSFQVTAQDVTTMMRQNLNAIIFLINNRGYSIEVEIHDGPAENNYNDIQNWDYVALVKAMDNGSDKVYAVRVDTEDQLKAAIEAASTEQKNRLVFIECTIDRDDCSKELLEWGARVSEANSRKPRYT